MNIEITGRHVKITAELEQYARTKAERIQKFVRPDARIEIILDHAHDKFQVEMIVSGMRGPVVIGHLQNDSPKAAIDLCVDKIDHQLRRLHDRKKHHHGGPSMAGDGKGGDPGLFGGDEGSIDDVSHER